MAQVIGCMDPAATLLGSWPLAGGVSAQVMALAVQKADGAIQKLVLRRHGVGDLGGNPHIARDEFRLLSILHTAGLAVPMPYFLDESCRIFSTPYLVADFIDGKTDFSPDLPLDRPRQLAAQLVQIHQMDLNGTDLSFLPVKPTPFSEQFQAPRNGPTLLHGDFWPGNILWRDGRLVGVIDWEDACTGDPVADVANSRLEILWAYGPAAMTAFTQGYAALNPVDFTDLPHWDLWMARAKAPKIGEWGLDELTEQRMRRDLAWFLARATERLND